MEQPEFPKDFYQHCPKAIVAAKNPEIGQENAWEFAECAFVTAGVGLRCENCNLHLTTPSCGREVDEKFLPIIKDYYKRLDEYFEHHGISYEPDEEAITDRKVVERCNGLARLLYSTAGYEVDEEFKSKPFRQLPYALPAHKSSAADDGTPVVGTGVVGNVAGNAPLYFGRHASNYASIYLQWIARWPRTWTEFTDGEKAVLWAGTELFA